MIYPLQKKSGLSARLFLFFLFPCRFRTDILKLYRHHIS